MIRRREFITLLGGATAAWPVAALAQQPGMPVVGYLHLGSPEPQAHVVAGFRKGLSEAGYVEGRNVAIEFRFGYDQFDRLTEMVADLVRRRVAVIAVPAGGTTALAAKAATTSIPIVFGTAVDPVQIGLVASLNRPGGNVTGISNMSVEITAKRLGLLHELLPNAARFAVLVNAQTGTPPTTAMIADVQAAASTIGSRIEVLTATDSREIDSAFGSLAQKRIDALIVTNSNLFVSRRTQFVTLAAHHRVPGSDSASSAGMTGAISRSCIAGRKGATSATPGSPPSLFGSRSISSWRTEPSRSSPRSRRPRRSQLSPRTSGTRLAPALSPVLRDRAET
jgi:putative ABC transport system substrate-binding protein